MRKITWYMSGFVTQAEAEKMHEEMMDWVRKTFDLNLWAVESGVRHGPYGFKAEIEASEVKANNAES